MTEYIDNQLMILNTIFTNSIQKPSPPLAQPPPPQPPIQSIKCSLFSHQVATADEMIHRMKRFTNGTPQNYFQIYSKIGILANSSNSGKTLTVLAMLAKLKENNIEIPNIPRLNPNSNTFFCSFQVDTQENFSSNINVVFVPQYLFDQWTQQISEYTTLKFTCIDSKKSLNKIASMPENGAYFLVCSKMYKNFVKFCDEKRLRWNIVIFDEINNIFINELELRTLTSFVWFVTSNWIPLIFKQAYLSFEELLNRVDPAVHNSELCAFLENNKNNTSSFRIDSSNFLKNILPYNNYSKHELIVRCNDEFINDSMKEITEKMSISIQSKLCRVGVTTADVRTIFQSSEIRMDDIMPLFYNDLNIGIKINSEIPYNILSNSSDDCAICLDFPKYPTISDCCKHIYCASCILKNTVLRGSCPLCRKMNNTNNLTMINSVDIHTNQSNNIAMNMVFSLKNKLDTGLDYLKDNSGDNILVISSHKNILFTLFEKLNIYNLEPQLTNNKSYYQLGNFNFISNVDSVSGLKFNNLKHILIFSEFFDNYHLQKFIHLLGITSTPCKVMFLQETYHEFVGAI